MQLLVIALAASLMLGPAPVAETVEAPTETQTQTEPAVEPEPAPALPDVDDGPDDGPEPEPIPEPEPEPIAKPEPPPPTADHVEPPSPAPVVRDKLGCAGSKPCRRMTVVGIVVGTLGVAALGTGIGLLVKRDEVIPESPTYVTSTRPPGVVTVTLGAGVTLTAVLMLVAAHRGYKQRGQQARKLELMPNGLRF